MTALADTSGRDDVVVMQCQTTGCPEMGYFVTVDLSAVRFAFTLRQHVLCARCRRPLSPRSQR